jgi:hypothetical protein
MILIANLLIGLAIAPTIDQGINCATGGDCRYTISAEAGLNRRNGDETAAEWCKLYSFGVSWVDGVRWSADSHRAFAVAEKATGRPNDHCEKWAIYETGELDAYKRLLPPIDYSRPEWVGVRKKGE